MGWRDQAAPLGAPPPPRQPLLNYGAPGPVRLAVGSARPRDRLSTLQQFYPDAKPYGDDNFLYSDPESGTATLYNPAGLDVGDLPSITRDAVTGLGAAAGATVGTPLGLGGALAGGTLGGTMASRGVDAALTAFGMPQAATPGDVAKDTTVDLLSNLGGEAGGMAVQALPRAAAGVLASRGAAQTADAARRLGVEPTVGMVGSFPVATSENLAARVLPGSRAAREQARFGEQFGKVVTDAVPGAPMTANQAQREAGAALKKGVGEYYTKFKGVRERIDQKVYSAFPQNAQVPITGLNNVLTDLRARISEAPEVFKPVLGSTLKQLEGVASSAARYGNQLPLKVQRNIRSLIGEIRDSKATTELVPEAQKFIKRAYGAMTDDLRGAAAAQSPTALRNLNRHDRLVRGFRGEDASGVATALEGRESVADSLDEIIKSGSDEFAYSALLSRSGGLNRMENVLGGLKKPQREVVARAAWDNMLTTPSGNVSLTRLAGQWNKMDPKARDRLFGQVTNTNVLNDIMTVIGGLKDADNARNFSNTAYALVQAEAGEKAMREIMTKVGGLAAGGSAGATGLMMFPTETIGTVAGAYLMSEAIHSPAMMRAMAAAAKGTAPEMNETVRRSIGRVVGRLLSEDTLTEDDQTISTSANVSRNSSPNAGWRAMSTTP